MNRRPHLHHSPFSLCNPCQYPVVYPLPSFHYLKSLTHHFASSLFTPLTPEWFLCCYFHATSSTAFHRLDPLVFSNQHLSHSTLSLDPQQTCILDLYLTSPSNFIWVITSTQISACIYTAHVQLCAPLSVIPLSFSPLLSIGLYSNIFCVSRLWPLTTVSTFFRRREGDFWLRGWVLLDEVFTVAEGCHREVLVYERRCRNRYCHVEGETALHLIISPHTQPFWQFFLCFYVTCHY